jgi:hypothetical protein
MVFVVDYFLERCFFADIESISLGFQVGRPCASLRLQLVFELHMYDENVVIFAIATGPLGRSRQTRQTKILFSLRISAFVFSLYLVLYVWPEAPAPGHTEGEGHSNQIKREMTNKLLDKQEKQGKICLRG